MRLLWWFTTPRRLRRKSLLALIIWTAVAVCYRDGLFDGIDWGIPDTAIPTMPSLAPRTPGSR